MTKPGLKPRPSALAEDAIGALPPPLHLHLHAHLVPPSAPGCLFGCKNCKVFTPQEQTSPRRAGSWGTVAPACNFPWWGRGALSGVETTVQSVVPGPALPSSPGSWLEMQILDPTPDLRHQNLWSWGSESSFKRTSPGDSKVSAAPRPTLHVSRSPQRG